MKKSCLIYIFIIFIISGCSRNNFKTINLSDDSKINYTVEGDKVINLELIQANNKVIVFFPEQNEMQFSIDNSEKKCNGIISEDFYSLEAINDEEDTCAINMTKSDTFLDLKADKNFRTVIQYNNDHKEAQHFEQIDGKEYSFKISKEGIKE